MSAATIDRWRRNGELEVLRTPGGHPRFRRRWLDEALLRFTDGSALALLGALVMVYAALHMISIACGHDPCTLHELLRHFDLDVDHPPHRHA